MAEVSALRDLEELRGYTRSNPLSVSPQEAVEVLESRGVEAAYLPFKSSWNPFDPNFRSTVRSSLNDLFGGSNIASNSGYRRGRIADALAGLVDFAPAIGDAVGVGDTMTSYRQGDMLGTGINAVATGVGVLPIVGAPASRAIRAGGNRVRSSLRDLPDPRYDPRVGEQTRIMESDRTVERTGVDAPTINLEDYEGRPFILGMSDRTDAGGMLTGVEGVEFNTPVPLQGGQGFMFNNPGQVWASDSGPSAALYNRAKGIKKETGQNPLFIPYRMAPTGGDYATMTGETMLSYAAVNMNKTNKRKLDSAMKKIIPGWKGVDDPLSIAAYREATGDQRKSALQVLDRDFRNKGGIGIGQARLAVSDPRQVNSPDFYTMNIGEINPDQPLIKNSGHATYNVGIPGQGLGTLEKGFAAPRLVPEFLRSRGVTNPENLPATEQYTIRRNVLSGILDEDILRALEEQ
jgi:hypothetical protein